MFQPIRQSQACRECCFSMGGQYFAAVNGTTISIYNTYTCENVGNLRGHNGKVRPARPLAVLRHVYRLCGVVRGCAG